MRNHPSHSSHFQTALENILYLLMGIVVLYVGGWRSLFSNKPSSLLFAEIAAAIPIAFFVFFIGLILTGLSVSEALHKFKQALHPPYPFRKSIVSKLWSVPLEELFWRASLMFLLPAGEPYYILISIAFALSHLKLRFDPFNILKYLDLFLFSWILCYLYHFTGNIYLVLMVHIVRNILVILNMHHQNIRMRETRMTGGKQGQRHPEGHIEK